MTQLFTAIMAAYGQTDRNVYRDPAGVVSFRIDDQTTAETQVGFGQISLSCDPCGNLTLELTSCPMDLDVRELIQDNDGEIHETHLGYVVTWPIPDQRGPQLVKQLALLIRRIVGRGRTYSDSNLKWKCPRAADTLEAFAATLKTAQRSCRPAKAAV